jgi:predicted Ser/Thr protein kinase
LEEKVFVGKCESVQAIFLIQYAVANFKTILRRIDSEVKSTQPECQKLITRAGRSVQPEVSEAGEVVGSLNSHLRRK